MTRDIVLNGRSVTIEPAGERRGRIVGGAPELYGRFVRNVFCATGKGGGVDATCGAGGGKEDIKRETVTVKGVKLTLEIGADGKGKVVEGPKEMIGKTLARKSPTPAPTPKADTPKPPPAPAKPKDTPKTSSEFKDAAAAETHYREQYHVSLRNGGKVSREEYLAAATHLAGETDRLTAAFPAVQKAIDRRKLTPGQTLEVGVAGNSKGAAEAGKYTAYRGIQLDAAPVDKTAKPDIGTGRHTVSIDLGGVYRHELGHEVWETVLPRSAQAAWIRLYDKSYSGGTAVSSYGGSHPNELWSESFSAFTSANYKKGSLPPDIEAFMTKALGAGPTTNAASDDDAAWNAFCPTGQGGGVDPTCSPGGSGGADSNEDWQPVPGPRGSQRLWQNKHEGRLRYSDTRPKGRTPEQQAKDAARRDVLVQVHASVAQHLDGGKSAKLVADFEGQWGLPKDATLKLVGNVKGSLVTASGDPKIGLSVEVQHPDVTEWRRGIKVQDDGRLTVYNSSFFLRPNKAGTGFGTDVFTAQVKGAIDSGATVISTTAGKGRASDGTPMNGYYTWPRLGYDANLEDSQRRRLPPGLKGAKTVLDLYETKEGRDWWKEHGSMMSMQFDVTPGSRSLTTLNGYLASKGKPTIEFPDGKWGETTAAIAARKGRINEGKHEQGLRNSAFLRATVQAQQAGLLATPYWHGADHDAAEMVGRVHNPDNRIPRSEVLSLAWSAVVSERANRRLLDRLNAMSWSGPEAKERARLLGTLNGDVLFEADETKARRRLLDLYDAAHPVTNVFCATGEGGGVDPSCSAGGGPVSVKASLVKETAPHPGSRPLGSSRSIDAEDADGNNLIEGDAADHFNTSLDRIVEAQQGHVSKRSRNPVNDREIINYMAEEGHYDDQETKEPVRVSRGVAFKSETEAREYLEKTVGTGWYTTRKKKADLPESFTISDDVAARFATRLSAQVMGPRERNAHGVVLEIEGRKVRGAALNFGEAEFVLPRGQAYKVTDILREVDKDGFATYRVKLTHDTSSQGADDE